MRRRLRRRLRLRLLSVVGTLHPHMLDAGFGRGFARGGRGRGWGGWRLGSGLSSAVEQRLGELLVLSRRSAPDSGITPPRCPDSSFLAARDWEAVQCGP
jgi:hypothetical protein